jgi:hypothetical protein
MSPAERERALAPPRYRTLARVLRPIRVDRLPALHSGAGGTPYFDEAATAAWLARFD